jgi:alkanesulfonate monooxygenase
MRVHWFLPTAGDGHGITGGGQAAATVDTERPPDLGYLTLVARAVERLGFAGVLTPTGTFCEDAWLTTAALIPETSTLRFLVAFRPGFLSPTLAAQMASTFQRLSGGRLMLNIVTGGESTEQRRFGDRLGHDQRYERTGEFLKVLRGAWSGTPFDFAGTHVTVEGATVRAVPDPIPPVFFGGSSPPALRVAAEHVDTYLTWAEPPADVAVKLDTVRTLAKEHDRTLWAGFGLVRPGAGTALVGSHAEVAQRIVEYRGLGIDHVILSGQPHLEEAYRVGENVLPRLTRLIGES